MSTSVGLQRVDNMTVALKREQKND